MGQANVRWLSGSDAGRYAKNKRLVYLCDWLPPDFGAVGQYAEIFAREWASTGWEVTLVGLTSGPSSKQPAQAVGEGTIEVLQVHRPSYNKQDFAARVIWTLVSNLKLVWAGLAAIRRAETVIFTGSPPLMLHFIAPLNVVLRKQLVYRISDFYPECLIAERGRCGPGLALLLKLTQFWRRRVHSFEVLGLDQLRRLTDTGIAAERIRVIRNLSPVVFRSNLKTVPLPRGLVGESGVILYSGNWGVAHDENTFIQAYEKYRRQSRPGLVLWLNATGAKADRVEQELRRRQLPMYRSSLVSLEDLPSLLLTADVHLITLRDSFVGYVLPSKVHACLESRRRMIFVGSERSDVHLLASRALPVGHYARVNVGDVEGLAKVLKDMEDAVVSEREGRLHAGRIEVSQLSSAL